MEKSNVDDLAEVAAMVFEMLRTLPRMVFIGAIALSFLAPWLPYAYRVATAKTDKKEGS